MGLAITAVASGVNFAVARVLHGAGRRYRSIALEADARHLMTDVWTSIGVVVGVALVALTGWQRLDPLVAIAVAVHVLVSGVSLLRRTAQGVLDTALPAADRAAILEVLDAHAAAGVEHHALRTRQAGSRRFVSVHILVPGEWSVQRGHDLLERIEREIRESLPDTTVFTHLEPLEDPVSWQDTRLERRPHPGDDEPR
jgi:cation diffusion facilitator family transporter